MTTISGVYTCRNAIEAGYPFVESILSVLPAVDEFLVNDGGSDDGTLDVMKRLEKQYDRIRLYQIDDYESERWETIDDQLEALIDEADGDWIFESQADEYWRHEDVMNVRRLVDEIDDLDYNSIRQNRVIAGHDGDGYEYPTVRLVRNVDDLRSTQGGDCFYFEGEDIVHEQYSAHNAYPEFWTDIEFYHFTNAFREQRVEAMERHAEHLATESEVRQDALERARE